MSLTIEFTEASATLEEISKLHREGRFRLREKPQTLPNGNVGFFLRYARFPAYLFQVPRVFTDHPSFCAEYGIRFTYKEEIRDGGSLPEGEYEYGDGIDMMVVQRGKDRDLGEKFSNVEIIGTDLKKICDAFVHLRTGKLKPAKPYSTSPGSIAAPASADEKEEGSGEHELPPVAATGMTAA